jgi:ribosomal protein S18 acetylase RimI-like enzyme
LYKTGGVTVNIVQTTDFELIAGLNREVQELHAQLFPNHFKSYDYDSIREFFKNIIFQPNYIFLVLEEEGQHSGYAWVELKQYAENAFRKPYHSVYVHQLSINENMRNRGWGTRLMESIVDIGVKNGVRRIELDYWVNNAAAIQFYRKHGFKVYREFVYKDL